LVRYVEIIMKSLKEEVIIFLNKSISLINEERNDLNILHHISNLNEVLIRKVDYVLDNREKFNLIHDQDS